jgi:ribosome-associated protein
MMASRTLLITGQLTIPLSELEFQASRAGGPGGQHVNRSATRIELVWNVAASPSLTEEQRVRLLERLATRLDSRGQLRIVAANRRSQLQNRDEAVERLITAIRNALRIRRPRKATHVPRRAVEARLDAKRRRSGLKASRRPVRGED